MHSGTSLLCLVALAALALPTLGQGTKADFDRSAALRAKWGGKLIGGPVFPHWFGTKGELWYRAKRADGKSEYVAVDPMNRTKRVVADLGTLPGARTSLKPLHPSETRGRDAGPETEIVFENKTPGDVKLFWVNGDSKTPYGEVKAGATRAMHTFSGHAWLVTKADGTELCGFVGQDEPGTAIVSGETPRRARKSREADAAVSPDGAWRVVFEGNNVVLKPTGGEIGTTLSSDGNKDGFYGPPVRWSPDSKRFTVAQTVPGEGRQIPIVSSAPKNQVQPTLRMVDYDKPGDRLPIARARLFDAIAKKQIPTAKVDALTPNPFYGDAEPTWSADSKSFTVTYNERGHQNYKVVEVDAENGRPHVLVDERAKTFIDWTNKVYFYDIPATNEFLWMSERDGWNHLYLMDRKTGAVKNQVTTGAWTVRGVESVDVKARTVTFQACGLFSEQDPYHVHYARVGFDGKNLVKLTEGDGNHKVTFSPDGKTLVDTYSRVDLAPVSELRSATDGKLVLTLEKADTSGLASAGWRAPERFVAKGRDGMTDIWGLIFRPSNFDPKRSYPVIENIYAGPHGQHVPKNFSEVFGSQELAELGFIVVQIDGMGRTGVPKPFTMSAGRTSPTPVFPTGFCGCRRRRRSTHSST